MTLFLALYGALVGAAVAVIVVLVWDYLSDRDPAPLDDRDRPGDDDQYAEWLGDGDGRHRR